MFTNLLLHLEERKKNTFFLFSDKTHFNNKWCNVNIKFIEQTIISIQFKQVENENAELNMFNQIDLDQWKKYCQEILLKF